MRIERLRVQGIGPFDRERTLAFPAQRTLVVGGNEAGKTSVAAAAYAAFFGLPDTGIFLPPEGPSWAEVLFQCGSAQWLIRREFRSDRVDLARRDGEGWAPAFEGTLDDPSRRRQYRNRLESILGMADGRGWLRTGLVLRGNLETHLDNAVWAWIAGNPSDDVEAVHATLNEARNRITGGNERVGPGELGEVREELRRQREEAATWETRAAELRSLWEELSASEAAREAATVEADRLRETLENLVRFRELTRDRNRLEGKLQQLREEQTRVRRQVEAVEAGKRRLEEQFSEFLDAPGDVEECLQEWTESVSRRRDLERDLERAQEAIRSLPVTRTRRNGILAAAVSAVVGWLACVGAGAMTAGLLLAPLFAVAGYAAVRYMDRNTERVRLSREQELVGLDSEYEQVLERERKARSGLGALTRFAEPSVLRKEYKRYMEARASLEHSRSAMESHRPLSEVVDAYESTFSDLQLLDTQTRDLVALAPHLSGLDSDLSMLAAGENQVRAERDEIVTRIEALETQTERLRTDAARREMELAEPGRLAEDIARLEERERDLAEKALALETASDVLRQTMRSHREGHGERVAKRAGALFARISRGRYRELRWVGTMEPEVREGDGTWRPPEALSDGARSQLFLALRLAAAEEAPAGLALPIILDDAFAGWDDDRLAEAGRILEEIGQSGRQVMVLGSDPRLSGWGYAVTALNAAPPETPASSQRAA